MTTDYKTVFQLAQDKGYNYTTSSVWKQQLEAFKYGLNVAHKNETDNDFLAFRTYFLNQVPNLLNDIQKWLRDEHKLFVSISYLSGLFWVELVRDYHTKQLLPIVKFHSYESALLEGINEALKLI